MKQKEAGIYRSEHFHSAGSVHFLTGVDRVNAELRTHLSEELYHSIGDDTKHSLLKPIIRRQNYCASSLCLITDQRLGILPILPFWHNYQKG